MSKLSMSAPIVLHTKAPFRLGKAMAILPALITKSGTHVYHIFKHVFSKWLRIMNIFAGKKEAEMCSFR